MFKRLGKIALIASLVPIWGFAHVTYLNSNDKLSACAKTVADAGVGGVTRERKLPFTYDSTNKTGIVQVDRFSVIFSGVIMQYMENHWLNSLYAQFGVEERDIRHHVQQNSDIHRTVMAIFHSVRKLEITFREKLYGNEDIFIYSKEEFDVATQGSTVTIQVKKRDGTIYSEATLWVGGAQTEETQLGALPAVAPAPKFAGLPLPPERYKQIVSTQDGLISNNMQDIGVGSYAWLSHYIGLIVNDRIHFAEDLEVGKEWMDSHGGIMAVGKITLVISDRLINTTVFARHSYVSRWGNQFALVNTRLITAAGTVAQAEMHAWSLNANTGKREKWPEDAPDATKQDELPRGFIRNHYELIDTSEPSAGDIVVRVGNPDRTPHLVDDHRAEVTADEYGRPNTPVIPVATPGYGGGTTKVPPFQ